MLRLRTLLALKLFRNCCNIAIALVKRVRRSRKISSAVLPNTALPESISECPLCGTLGVEPIYRHDMKCNVVAYRCRMQHIFMLPGSGDDELLGSFFLPGSQTVH